jgi:prepilin-type N-terminal cleavage/methylation domain-containing protein
MKFKNKNLQGFTLLEMAIVLIILGFVLGALLLPLQAQRNQLSQSQTENTLELAKKALLGFAQQYGRLPCPATALSNIDAGSRGQEDPLGGTHNITPPTPAVPTCVAQSGFLPAATLGLQPTDQYGFALDAWNNRIRYAITNDNSSNLAEPYDDPATNAFDIIRTVDGSHPACGGDSAPDFTTTNNLSFVGLSCLAPTLKVCKSSSAIDCTNSIYLTNNAVTVIYSTGANGSLLDTEVGVDEVANKTATTTFYSREPTAKTLAPSNEFDDMVVWISPYTLYNAMIEAGQLH